MLSGATPAVPRRGRARARAWTGAGAAGAALVAALAGAPSAAAAGALGQGSGGSSGRGYTADVVVVYSGPAAPSGASGGGSSGSVAVQPSCWWSPMRGADASDPVAVRDFFASSREPAFFREVFGSSADWDAAVDAAAAGTPMTWYLAECQDPSRLAEFTSRSVPSPGGGVVPVVYAAWPTAQGPPPPQVDPYALALAAHDAMVIPDPEVDRNPRSSGLGATFVGLPTWFWVTDPEAVGGAAGTRTIRATVGDVWAEVTATTGGLTVSSPLGAADCDPETARTPWSPGADDDAGCTVVFTRSSAGYPGGVPLDLSTRWAATYTASDGSGGDLEGLVRTADDAVPVAESQALVSSAG